METHKIEVQHFELEGENLKEFEIQLEKDLHEFQTIRCVRPQPPAGYKFKRDWYDRMISNDIYDVRFFVKHFEDVYQGKSLLNAEARRVIGFFCENALEKVINKLT